MRFPWPGRQRRSRSLLFQFFMATALIVAVPMLTLIALADYALMSSMNREIARAGMGKLRVASGITEMVEEILRNTAVSIALDPMLEDLSTTATMAEITADGLRQFTYMTYQNHLSEYSSTHPMIHSVYVYLKDVDWVISTVDGTVGKEDFSDRAWLEALLASPQEEWNRRSWIPHYPLTTQDQVGVYTLNPKGQQVISRVYALSPYLSTLDGWVIINLQERELSRLVNSSNFDREGSISLVSPEGLVMSSPHQDRVGTTLEDPEILRVLRGNDNSGWIQVGGMAGDKLVTWQRHSDQERILLGEFDLGNLTGEIQRVRLASLGISLGVMALGLAVSWVVSRRFFNPVHRLVQAVKARGRDEGETEVEGNEVLVLEQAMNQLLRQETQWFTSLEAQKRQAREEQVLDLLRGAGARELPETLGLEPGRWTWGAFLAIDGLDDFHHRFVSKDQAWVRSLLGHLMEEAFAPELRCRASSLEEGGVWLVMQGLQDPRRTEDRDALIALVAQRFAQIGPQIQQVLQGSASLCLGPIHGDPEGVNGDADLVLQGLKRRFLLGWASCIPWETGGRGGSAAYPRKETRRILSALESGQEEALDQALDHLFSLLREREGLTHDHIILVLTQVVSDLVRFLLDRNLAPSQVEGLEEDLQRPIVEWETLDRYRQWLGSTMGRCLALCRHDGEEEDGGIEKVMAFIRENYRRDIGIEAVADHVGLSYSHVRKIFHEHRGESMVCHINSLRVDEARTLLRQTDLCLEDIARSVGYNNTQGLNRHFKRLVGLPPGEYRAQHRN